MQKKEDIINYKIRTSESDLIRVDWLPVNGLGRVGLPFALGRRVDLIIIARPSGSGIWSKIWTTWRNTMGCIPL